MDAWLSYGTLGMSGKAMALRHTGSLRISSPQPLIVTAQHRGAFDLAGNAVRHTQRLWGLGNGECPDPHPPRLPSAKVVHQHDDKAVWGGFYTYHYGHFLTESVSRLWPLLPGSDLHGLPVVFTTPSRKPFISEWEAAFGVDVIELPPDGAVRFSQLYVPEPAWRMSAWISPEIRDIHLHARSHLDVPALRNTNVLWLSRTKVERNRRIHDESLCQWLLGDRIKVIHPQTLTLANQVAEIEACDGLIGPIGSAFHTQLLARSSPRCIYLSPSAVTSAFVAQDQLLGASNKFVHALANHRLFPEGQDRHPYRLLVPETLRALDATLLPDLLDDQRLWCMAYPERGWSTVTNTRPKAPELDTLIARVLLDPNRLDARMELGSRFEKEGVLDCAVEQFGIVADSVDYWYASLRAARILTRLGLLDEAQIFARRVLQAEPDCEEARGYVEGQLGS